MTDATKKNRLTPLGCTMVGVAAIFYLYEFFLRVAPSAMTHELMAYFQTNAAGLSFLAMGFFWGYTPMQIPAGLLGDRFGPKKVLIAAAAVCTLSTTLFATTTHLSLAIATRFFIGIAASFAYIGPLMIADRWLPKRYFATATGSIQMMGCLGAILGGEPIAELIEKLSWQSSMLYAAAAGAIMTVLFALILRSRPKQTINESSSCTQHCEWRRLRSVLGNAQIRWTALIGFSFWAPMSCFAELWGVPYLMELRHISAVHATALTQAIWWGVALGGPLMGTLTQKIKRRRLPILLSLSMAMMTSLLLIVAPPQSNTLLQLVLFGFGLAASAQCVTFGVISDIADPDSVGTAIGFNNMAVITGGLVAAPLIGQLLQAHWQGVMIHNHPIYAISTYQHAFWIMPFCTALGLFSALFKLKETHCRPPKPVEAAQDPKAHWLT